VVELWCQIVVQAMRISIELCSILRDSAGLHGLRRTPWDSKGLHGTPKDSMGLRWIPWDSIGLHGTPLDSIGLRGTPFCRFPLAITSHWNKINDHEKEFRHDCSSEGEKNMLP
jgi:hypothetical protein